MRRDAAWNAIFLHAFIPEWPLVGVRGVSCGSREAEAAATIPLKRIGHVEDTAAAIEACATTLRFATGSRFVVDGGRSL